jgi:predicted phosphoribosyltransferase
VFRDRAQAGRRLAERLLQWQWLAAAPDLVVLGLPRGGVPVAAEVADELLAPLDVFLVRKLGVPGHEELAMGAIAPGGVRVLNDDVIASLGIDQAMIEEVAGQEAAELDRRLRAYRDDRPPLSLTGRTVVLVDDGLATGASMRAAVRAIRAAVPANLVVAVPVGAESTCSSLTEVADRVLCLETPEPFHAVGSWYEDFSQTTDDEVRRLLARSRSPV